MTIYWQSTKAPVHLFKREYECEELAKQVSENSFVDAAILAADLGVSHLNPQAVAAYQRRLGVRQITGTPKPTKKKPVRKPPTGREEILQAYLRCPDEGARLAASYGKSKDYAYKLAHARKLLPHQRAEA